MTASPQPDPSLQRIGEAHQHVLGRAWPQLLRTRGRAETGRDELEAFVHGVYARAFGAQIEHYLDVLMGLSSAPGELVGAIGVTPAASAERLFLEVYLDQPIERELSARVGASVERASLAEVGNLVARPGHGPALVSTMAAYLDGAGIPWSVFTATTPLLTSLARLGIRVVDLGPADGARLGADLARWGSYYASAPRLTAALIPDVRRTCLLEPRLALPLAGLWSHAFASGFERAAAGSNHRRSA